MEVFTSRSRDQLPIFSAGSRSLHRDRFLPTHLPRFRARCARSSPLSLLALELPFLPAHHSRYQFRMVVRYLRLLQRALLSSASARSLLVVLIARGNMTKFSLPSPFSCHFRPPALLKGHFLRQLASSSPRHLLKCCFALLQGHFGRSHVKPHSFMPPLYGGKHSLRLVFTSIYTHIRALCTAAWFLPFCTRGGSDPSGRSLRGAMPVSGMPCCAPAPGGIAG